MDFNQSPSERLLATVNRTLPTGTQRLIIVRSRSRSPFQSHQRLGGNMFSPTPLRNSSEILNSLASLRCCLLPTLWIASTLPPQKVVSTELRSLQTLAIPSMAHDLSRQLLPFASRRARRRRGLEVASPRLVPLAAATIPRKQPNSLPPVSPVLKRYPQGSYAFYSC